MEITVRPLKEDEKKIIKKMGQRAFAGMESLWVPTPKTALVALADGKPAGAILYKIMKAGETKIGYVDYAFVDPAFHNHGVGGRLYRETADFLWEQGCDVLTAAVKDDNVASWGLFRKNGFSRVSLPAMVREIGLWGTLGQYFATPLCIGVGMECYMAVKDNKAPEKGGSTLQILFYLLVNLLIILCAGVITGEQRVWRLVGVYAVFLAGGVMSSGLSVLISKREWSFRFNNGGGVISCLIGLVSLFPMVGNWYPNTYENTKDFRKDMAINSLLRWLYTLILALLPLALPGVSLVRMLSQIAAVFLLYHIMAFYPFESVGGLRIYRYNKCIYLCMSVISAIALRSIALLSFSI